MNFEQWLAAVDQAVFGLAFCSVHDLSDQPFRDWFEDEVTPQEAAELALADNGFDLEGWQEVEDEIDPDQLY